MLAPGAGARQCRSPRRDRPACASQCFGSKQFQGLRCEKLQLADLAAANVVAPVKAVIQSRRPPAGRTGLGMPDADLILSLSDLS